MKHILIIGNGISGISAARHIRKLSHHRITVISKETDHFFSRTALMYIYMGHMTYENTKPFEDSFWEKNKIELLRAEVTGINAEAKSLQLKDKPDMPYDELVLAVGSTYNRFGWPGQDLEGVGGLYSYQDLEYMEKHSANCQRAVIVGGGLIGVEMAEMFMTRGIDVTFLVREDRFWGNVLPKEEGELVSRHMREHHVDLRLSTELKEIVDDGSGKARAVITNTGEEIACQFVGLTAGVRPNIAFLKETALETNRGILVDEYLQTNLPNVYAIGDCAERRNPLPNRRPLEQVWYTGRMMGETLAQSICQKKTEYNPGIWFNSAKFFDIEYQTYGWVFNNLREGEATFYWESSDGKKCLRINYAENDGRVLGINVFGIRQRHDVWDTWFKNEITIDRAMEMLPRANFDPEFFKQYEGEIIAAYNKETGKQLKIKSKKGLWARLMA